MNPTAKPPAYLDYIQSYVALHGQAPSEAEMVAFFQVAAVSADRTVVTLAETGLSTREPGKARWMQLVQTEPTAPEDGPEAEDDVPTHPVDDIYDPLDPEIEPLVLALRADPRILTKGSCWGHRKRPASVDLAVDGLDGLRVFVRRINEVDREIEPDGILDVALNWSEEVATACAFDVYPTWIMLSLTIEGIGKNGAPSAALLARVAASYERAAARKLPRR